MGYDAYSRQVVNFIELDALALHFLKDAEKVLRPAFYGGFYGCRFHLFGNYLCYLLDVGAAFFPLGGDLGFYLFIIDRPQMFEGYILQLVLDPAYTKPVGQGRIYVQGLPGYPLALPLRQMIEGAHVVKPVGQLDYEHPDVLGHGQDHLSDVFRLALLCAAELYFGEFGDPVHQLDNLIAERFPQFLHLHGGIFHYVVEQARRHGGGVHLELGQEVGHFEGMGKEGSARHSHLPPVGLGGYHVSVPDNVLVLSGVIGVDLFYNVIEVYHQPSARF